MQSHQHRSCYHISSALLAHSHCSHSVEVSGGCIHPCASVRKYWETFLMPMWCLLSQHKERAKSYPSSRKVWMQT